MSDITTENTECTEGKQNKFVRTRHHMCVDIEGVLRFNDSKLRNLFMEEDGAKRPAKMVRDWLRLQLAEGKQVLPIGEKCEGWSDITGCPGNRIEEEVAK